MNSTIDKKASEKLIGAN